MTEVSSFKSNLKSSTLNFVHFLGCFKHYFKNMGDCFGGGDPTKEKHVKQNRCFQKKIGVPQNGWFRMENPIKMDDLGVSLFSETSKWRHSSAEKKIFGPRSVLGPIGG